MLFSECFDVTRAKGDDWFDPILESDTELFVDPFLLFKEESEEWDGVHGELIDHFDRIFVLLARSGGLKASPYYAKAIARLLFPEPSEYCLGYTARGVRGAGGGRGLAEQIATAMVAAIERSTRHLDHFEVLGIFNDRIGPDRISDVTCTILKDWFIDYTREVVERHGIRTDAHVVEYAGVSSEGEWSTLTVDLPTNPNTGRPVILVPDRFLRRLPTLNAGDWWRYYNMRASLNIEILERVDKARIVREALRNLNVVAEWVQGEEEAPPRPYDLSKDRDLVWQWEPVTAAFALAFPMNLLSAVRRKSDFFGVVDAVCGQFKQFVENEAGWQLLWNDDGSEKHERAAQNLFRGIAKHYCRANDIAIDREVDLGRGPVDFKFSRGVKYTAHLEVKKLDNGKFWHGLHTQLPIYMKSDEVQDGWLMGVQLKTKGVSAARARRLPEEVLKASKASGLNLRYALVDARPKDPASKAPGKSSLRG